MQSLAMSRENSKGIGPKIPEVEQKITTAEQKGPKTTRVELKTSSVNLMVQATTTEEQVE